jgi:hypothetical protein
LKILVLLFIMLLLESWDGSSLVFEYHVIPWHREDGKSRDLICILLLSICVNTGEHLLPVSLDKMALLKGALIKCLQHLVVSGSVSVTMSSRYSWRRKHFPPAMFGVISPPGFN